VETLLLGEGDEGKDLPFSQVREKKICGNGRSSAEDG
jgi:hypothetical protein